MSGPWRQHELRFNQLKNGQLISTPYLLFLPLVYPYFNTTGHSTLCSFSQCHIVPHILSSPFTLSVPQSFSHGPIPLHPSLPLSFTDNLPRVASLPLSSLKLSPFTTQNPRGKKQQRKSRGREREKRNEGLGRKKSLISKALNPILYHG